MAGHKIGKMATLDDAVWHILEESVFLSNDISLLHHQTRRRKKSFPYFLRSSQMNRDSFSISAQGLRTICLEKKDFITERRENARGAKMAMLMMQTNELGQIFRSSWSFLMLFITRHSQGRVGGGRKKKAAKQTLENCTGKQKDAAKFHLYSILFQISYSKGPVTHCKLS